MSAPGFWEIMFLALLALLIFGPNRLPEVAKSVGKAIGKFKQEASSTLEDLKAAADVEEYKGLSNELKATTADLKRSAALTGPLAAAGGAGGAGGEQEPTVAAVERPPFDPDAT